jgi:hypothetical protein
LTSLSVSNVAHVKKDVNSMLSKLNKTANNGNYKN